MITNFKIENYKSINKLTIDLGRVNVFIGENGCGKSNIIEAIALASAATEDKLDNEFLTARGVRVTVPKLMRSAYELDNIDSPIKVSFSVDNDYSFEYELLNDNIQYSKWMAKPVTSSEEFAKQIRNILASELDKNSPVYKFIEVYAELVKLSSEINNIRNERIYVKFYDVLKNKYALLTGGQFKNFLIYSPENTSLRIFEKEGQIEPLGVNGEGLFKLIKYFSTQTESGSLEEIKRYLQVFDWFKDFSVPEKLFEGESYLQIQDRYIDKSIELDQRSSNEGFLFVLFYLALLVSDKTPSFFAIDNIEASLNPKLCTKLIKTVAELSERHQKQVILTTHSPSVLDGLNLNDPEQKLFLVYRNKLGHTTIKELEKPKNMNGQEPVRLSEAFLRGYIGGLPKNFSL